MTPYDKRHAKRYVLSLEALRPLLKPGIRVLECGERSSFADRLQQESGVQVEHTGAVDLRGYAFREFGRRVVGRYAAVLCMEVLEHIHDSEPAEGIPTEWTGSGTASLLSSLHSLLAPGGLLFLTTPNAASLNVLHKVLTQQPPMVYRPHVREYAPHELAELVKRAGFERITVTSHDVWDNDCMSTAEARKLRETIAALGYRTDCRGEDLFLTAYKGGVA